MANSTGTNSAPPQINPLGDPAADPLAELRDIHLPAPPEVWPPALGWWLLALMLVAALVYLGYLALKYWQQNRYRRAAKQELEQIFAEHQDDPTVLVAQTNLLLKRAALSFYPRSKVAQLTGETWVAFLDASAKTHEFTMGAGQILIDGPYTDARNDPPELDPEALYRVALNWIQHHREVTP